MWPALTCGICWRVTWNNHRACINILHIGSLWLTSHVKAERLHKKDWGKAETQRVIKYVKVTHIHTSSHIHNAPSTGLSKCLHSTYSADFPSSSLRVKPGFHYPSWRSELTGDRFPLPVNTGCVDGRAFPLAELMGRQHGPCWRVMETSHPSTRAVNSGSKNRA